MTSDDDGRAKVANLIKGFHVAMVTTTSVEGGLRSRPLAPQQVDFDGDVRFIVERDSSVVSDVTASPAVNVAYVDGSTWVSVSGTARVVNDEAKLAELWDTFTDAWLEGGPEDPRNVLLQVSAESAEFWDSPGAKVTQVANLVKAKVTGERLEADMGKVDL
jgi:general stress protein 26